jgi:dihydrofolate reductase
MAENRVIGRGNRLPWRLPDDLKRFKALTMGNPVIMGRKTFDTLDAPLTGRRNIVITRDPRWTKAGVEVAHTWEEAMRLASGPGVAYVAGGEQVYRLALPRAQRLDLTLVHAQLEGDARFPEFDPSRWTLTLDERHEPDAKHAYAFSFRRYERTDAAAPRAA